MQIKFWDYAKGLNIYWRVLLKTNNKNLIFNDSEYILKAFI